MSRIACIGEVMIELSLLGTGQQALVGVAGDTFNTAVYLQRSAGNAHAVSYVTVLGADDFSQRIIRRMELEQIDTSLIGRTEQRVPGLYAISTDEFGERSFTYWRDQSSARLLFDAGTGPALTSLLDFDVIYHSAITLAILPAEARQRFLAFLSDFRSLPGKQVAFDSNYRPRLWGSQDQARQYTEIAWRQCDIGFPSLDDEQALFGDADEQAVLARLHSFGVVRGALKRGARGPLDLAEVMGDGRVTGGATDFAVVDKVIDSTAAGDSFNGACLASLLTGGSAAEALRAGHACASQVIQNPGAIVDPD